MPGDFLELAAHLDHHRARGTSHRHHAQRAEHEGQRAADEETDHHEGILQAEFHRQAREVVVEILGVGSKQHQRRKAGRTDGIALGHRLGRVAHRVERVGRLAHFLGQVGHLGDAAGIVGDRAIGIERDDHAGQRQHGGRGKRDTEQAGSAVGDDDADADHEHRQERRFHRHGQALDDVGGVARRRCLGDAAHRAIGGGGVVLGDPHQQAGDAKPDKGADEHAGARDAGIADLHLIAEANHFGDDAGDQRRRDDAGDDQPLVERAHDVLRRRQARRSRCR